MVPSTLFHLIPNCVAAASAGSGEWTEPGRASAGWRADPAPHGESGLIVVGWLGLSHHEGAGVAPQPAARAVRIGTVVGCGDEHARDAAR
jgi:hypothetical protein